MNMKIIIVVILCFLFKENLCHPVYPYVHYCDFKDNEILSVKPYQESNKQIQNTTWCVINEQHVADIVVVKCPNKKVKGFENIEIIPSDNFASVLHSAFGTDDKPHNIIEYGVSPNSFGKETVDDNTIMSFIVDTELKKKQTMYIKCDNSKTEDTSQQMKGKIGIVKININQQNANILTNIPDEQGKSNSHGFVKSKVEDVIEPNEHDIISLVSKEFNPNDDGNCIKDILNLRITRYGSYTHIRMPTIFLNDIQCNITFSTTTNAHTYSLKLKITKTKNIEGCDFTKPEGEGIFNNGFELDKVKEENNTCVVELKYDKKIVAGIKCPHTLTPTYCFKTVFYEQKVIPPPEKPIHKMSMLSDVVGTTDIEYYMNVKEKIFIVGFPTKLAESKEIMCKCENANKKIAIMLLKIASAYSYTFSFILMIFIIIISYVF
ncbi:6-cysteine protein [Hepatocystis sp. ex Piliocolobus tephrosceles]|nr:6-cysteine protein [Hepatocystis sp. ex Piliocolobus tephrosceles]